MSPRLKIIPKRTRGPRNPFLIYTNAPTRTVWLPVVLAVALFIFFNGTCEASFLEPKQPRSDGGILYIAQEPPTSETHSGRFNQFVKFLPSVSAQGEPVINQLRNEPAHCSTNNTEYCDFWLRHSLLLTGLFCFFAGFTMTTIGRCFWEWFAYTSLFDPIWTLIDDIIQKIKKAWK